MRSLLFATVCLFSVVLHAQERVEEDSLVSILRQVEGQFGVRFSYSDELIQDKQVTLQINESTDLYELLNQLQEATNLRFNRVGEGYVVIRQFENDDELSVCGYLHDETGKPMFGVLIRSDSGVSTVSDLEGYFQLTMTYGDVLNFQYLGYQTKRRSAPELMQAECPVLTMNEVVSYLEAVTIQNYTATGVYKATNKVQIYPGELTVLPGLIEPDVLESIQQTPGVNSPYETVSGLHVRGGSPDQNLVLWNGITTYNQGHFFGMLSSFNPYITQRVDFVKNAPSAAYGGRVSGIVDIHTSSKVSSDVTGGAGFNMLYGDAFVSTPIVKEKLSLTLSGRRSYTDWLSTPTYQQYAKRVFQNTKIGDADDSQRDNDFFFTDYNASVVFEPTPNQTIQFSSLYYKNDLTFNSKSDIGESFEDDLLTQNEGYGISWELRKKGLEVSQGLEYSNYLLWYQFQHTENDTLTISSKKNLVSDFAYHLDGTMRFSDTHELTIGYQFNRNHTRYAFEDLGPAYQLVLDQDDRSQLVNALYSEYELKTDRFAATVGTRANYYHDFNKLFLEPRLNIAWQILDPLHITASGEYRTQFISQIKESVVSDLSLENQVWKLASKDRFPIIKSYQFTAGFNFSQKGWFFEAEGYRKQIDGVTSLTFGFLNPIDNAYRIGESAIHGVDVFLKKNWGAYKSWVSYSFLHTQNRFTGLNNDKAFPGNWNIRHLMNWSHFYSIGNLHLSAGWKWHTGKAYTNVSVSDTSNGPVTIDFDQINGENLPVYHRLDFSALYEIKPNNKKVWYRVGVSVLNVYNRKNILNREFRTTPSLDNELIDTRIYSLGITPNVVFRVFY
ncbi:TonB-dependent receptor plug domain-containing protein [Marinoscillum sp.]|uniref:TonB-dependent receptor plug domain-containing protein n=1 Tax=Marinoscillum sp. TaxID=2024838 RepID=UPI003BAA3803